MTYGRAMSLVCLVCVIGATLGSFVSGQEKGYKYTSERNVHPFVGATRVVVDGFNPMAKDLNSATLQLDKNEVTFSAFGEAQITAVFYKPFPVKLTRINLADPAGKDRRIFAVELPTEFAADLGKNTLRLVTPTGGKADSAGIRLLIVSPENKVTQTLDLRPATN